MSTMRADISALCHSSDCIHDASGSCGFIPTLHCRRTLQQAFTRFAASHGASRQFHASFTTASTPVRRCWAFRAPHDTEKASNATAATHTVSRWALEAAKRWASCRAVFPTLKLSVPDHVWGAALSSPLLMRPVALSAGLPSLLPLTRTSPSSAWSAIRDCTYAQLRRSAVRYLLQPAPLLPTRAQIDARLRRSMESALQHYTASLASARLVLVNAIQTSGASLPYALGALVAEFLQRQSSQCLAPPEQPRYMDVSVPIDAALAGGTPSWRLWCATVVNDLAGNAAMILHVLRLFVLFAPLAALAPLAFYADIGRASWMRALRETFELAGPAFIKWGQWAATRHDMFPPDMCAELERLQSSAPRHSWAFTMASIEKSFGMPLDAILDSIEREPIASGSIGQIHKGVLSQRGAEVCGVPGGTVVALKVKHPNVSASIQQDFGLMMWIASQLEWLPALKKLRVRESLQQFAGPLREQVDLSLEANTLWRFNQNFSRDRNVSLPMPLYPWISQDVLMQSFEEGMHISEYMVSDSDPERRSAVASVGSHTMLNMLLVHNLIHSDLHPGNILVRWQLPEGILIDAAAAIMQRFSDRKPEQMFGDWLQPHVVLLDVGMATELSKADQLNMYYLFKAFSEMDGLGMADAALSFAGHDQGCVDRRAFKDAIAEKVDVLKADTWQEAGYDNAAAAFSSILEDVRRFEVTLPGHIASVLVTTLVLEGWSSELSPEASVLEEVKGMLAMDTRSWRERLSHTVDQWSAWAPVLPALDAA